MRRSLKWQVSVVQSNAKRVGFGFRNFANYRLRLLRQCGITWHDVPVARIRGRKPRFMS